MIAARRAYDFDTDTHTPPSSLNAQELCSLLSSLLQHEPAARPGAAAARAHPWFSGLDWAALRAKKLDPPPLPGGRGSSARCGGCGALRRSRSAPAIDSASSSGGGGGGAAPAAAPGTESVPPAAADGSDRPPPSSLQSDANVYDS